MNKILKIEYFVVTHIRCLNKFFNVIFKVFYLSHVIWHIAGKGLILKGGQFDHF